MKQVSSIAIETREYLSDLFGERRRSRQGLILDLLSFLV